MTTVFTLAVLVSAGCGERALLSSPAARELSPCGPSRGAAQALGCVDLRGCSSWAQEHRLSGCGTRDLPGLGIKPTSRGSPQVFLSLLCSITSVSVQSLSRV